MSYIVTVQPSRIHHTSMSTLLALDVAILPPPDVNARAVSVSATLPAAQSQGLRLDADRRPHITLTQQFVPSDEVSRAEQK